MAVFVDQLRRYDLSQYHGKDAEQARRIGARNGHRWSHMMTDDPTYAELHAMARRIGMRRSWFQGDHYDLTPGRRAKAVEYGAVEIDEHGVYELLVKTGRRKPRQQRVIQETLL